MRELVTIRRIAALEPIAGADRIEVAGLCDCGWRIVVAKGQFTLGEAVLMLEIDSFIPASDARFEFLRNSSFKTDSLGRPGFRLRTIKLKGIVSQGLLMPLKGFPELLGREDEVLAQLLGVVTWEPPVPAELAGEIAGPLPGFIRKTDQPRIQNLPNAWERYRDEVFEASVKVDGSSGTFYLRDGHFGVCGHNWEYLEDPRNSFWKVARRCLVEPALRQLGRPLALQGELYGEGIQGNPEWVKDQHLAIFDIWDIAAGRYLTPDERLAVFAELCGQGMTLAHVPTERCRPFLEFPTLEALLAAADGPSLNPKVQREGLVYKSVGLVLGQTVSFKVISNSYLLLHG